MSDELQKSLENCRFFCREGHRACGNDDMAGLYEAQREGHRSELPR